MISLKKLNEEHLTYRIYLLNNLEISQHLNTSEIFNLEKTLLWYNSIKDEKSRFDCVFYHTNCIVGMGGLINISNQNKNAELYLYIDPIYQGKGYGYQSLYELCNYGFKYLQLNKIYLYTFSDNKKANYLYEKMNFKLEGVLRKHTMKNGILKDRNLYGLLISDFTYI